MADLIIRRGDRESFLLTIVRANGTPLNLSGLTVWMTVKSTKSAQSDDTDAAFKFYWEHNGTTLVGSNGLSTVDIAAGKLRLTVLPGNTIGQADKRFLYDIQVRLATDDIKTWDEGTLTINADLTQRTTTP